MSKQPSCKAARKPGRREDLELKNIIFPKQPINPTTEKKSQLPEAEPWVWESSRAAPACATSTHLGLPLSPETSSPSEGGNPALRADAGACDDGYMLRFGKHFSKISHICACGEKQTAVQTLALLCEGLYRQRWQTCASRHGFPMHLPGL